MGYILEIHFFRFLDKKKIQAVIQKNLIDKMDVVIPQASTKYDPAFQELVDK